jgi:hypothetical protein
MRYVVAPAPEQASLYLPRVGFDGDNSWAPRLSRPHRTIVARGEKKKDEAGELAGVNTQLSRDQLLGIKNNRRLNKRGLSTVLVASVPRVT